MIIWDHIHLGIAFVFVHHLAQLGLLLLGVCCITKLFLKIPRF